MAKGEAKDAGDKGAKEGKMHHADKAGEPRTKLDSKTYFAELGKLQIELVKLQEWIKAQQLKVVTLFEGRDAAGKGGTIKRITETLNPRVVRVDKKFAVEETSEVKGP